VYKRISSDEIYSSLILISDAHVYSPNMRKETNPYHNNTKAKVAQKHIDERNRVQLIFTIPWIITKRNCVVEKNHQDNETLCFDHYCNSIWVSVVG
jgi:hypothetical protein